LNITFVLRVVSVLLLLVSGFMAASLGVALLYGEGWLAAAFLVPIAASVMFFLATAVARRTRASTMLSVRSSYFLVALSWLLASALSALPFMISGAIPAFVDAFFETMSGYTTTGASILSDVEKLPRGILFWRSTTHWLGGMGIVVLTVALFPLLGIGGLKLVDAEAPGPTVDKVSPRISTSAKALWTIYVLMTVVEIALLALGGMDLFDAATHTFGTVATGGFSTRNASVGSFHSAYIDVVITVFMVLAGANFNLYYALGRGELRRVLADTELRAYLGIFAVSTLAIALDLRGNGYRTFAESLRYAGFQSASVLTTTGFTIADFEKWPPFGQVVLFVLMWIGGCAGSTGGGIKVIRLVTLFKQAITELRYMLNPRGVVAVRVGGQSVRKNVVYSVYAFVFLYLCTMFVTVLVVASGGYDIVTSLTATLATLGNIGPGFGAVGPVENYGHFPAYIKAVLSLAMMAGRLEIYTVVLLLTPRFWRG
jgi:trk system potassium uptake protein TrkH